MTARRYTDQTMREAYLMGFRGAKENPRWGEYDAAAQALTLWPDPPSSAPPGEGRNRDVCHVRTSGVVRHCWHQADQVQVGYLSQITRICCHCGQLYQELEAAPNAELSLSEHGPYAQAKL